MSPVSQSISSPIVASTRSLCAAMFGLLLLFGATACGDGGTEPSVGEILGAAKDLELNDDGASINVGDAAIALGSDVGRPSWLDD